jgi:integrase
MRKALADAVDRGYVLRNVADLAHPPTQRAARSSSAKVVWSPAQLRAFLTAAADDRLYAALLLLATTGMRRGEVAGLRWSTVDLDAATLTIRYTATMVGGLVIDQDSAKTDAGERTIALDPATVDALREHRRAQREDRLAVGELWTESGRVFVDQLGRPVRPDVLLRRVRHHADAAGLPPVTVHQLRHSYATAALRAGVPVEVLSKRLGHASIAITLDTYRHVQEGEDQAAAALAAGAILGP